MAEMRAKCVVWGCKPIPENIIGIPEGAKVRFRIRNTDAMRCYIRKDGETREYVLLADTLAGPWYLEPQGANVRQQHPLRPSQPQYWDHQRLVSTL